MREMVLPNEKRKRANPCGEHRRMSERRQMNVLIIFLDNKSAMPHHSASLQLQFRFDVTDGLSTLVMNLAAKLENRPRQKRH